MKLTRITAGKYSTHCAYIERDAMTKSWLVYHDGDGIPSLAFPTLHAVRAYLDSLVIDQRELLA